MRLVIREYLGMLKESKEFDALLPDLLLAMNIVPISKAQIGVRQAGVDIAAVGDDETGNKALWLFVVKCGDLGRREWDSQPQSVRQSLDEIKDIYLRNHVEPEHVGLPVKIIVVTTGDFKQDFEQNRVGYADANTLPSRTFQFWNGDKAAALVEKYLLNEYALPDAARSQLRRTLALIGEPVYDMEHFFALLNMLLPNEPVKPKLKEKESLRAIITISLALGIACRWASQEGNLRGAIIICERSLLWTWDAIRSRNLTKNKKIIGNFIRLVHLYLSATAEYFNKVQPHLHVRDALARYHREAALLAESVFEEIGLISTIGLSHLTWGIATKDEKRVEAASIVADTLNAFLSSHRCSGSPRYDRNIAEISLAFLLLVLVGRVSDARVWLKELAGRLSFAFNFDRWFPISTDSFDDLVSFEIDREEVDVAKLKETSWMVPTLAQWAAVLREDEAYQKLAVVASETLKHTCFQIWYPDEKTDEIMYHRTSHVETGIAEAPVSIPSSSDEMRANMKNLRSDSPIKEPFKSSATQAGFGWLDFIACRHYGTPLDPAVWQSLVDIPPGHETKDSPPSGQNKISL